MSCHPSYGRVRRAALGLVLSVFLASLLAHGLATEQAAGDLKRPIPERARRLVQEGRRLAQQDNFAEAEARFRQAIQLAPNFVQAHLDLVYFKAYYLEDVAGAEAEYKALATREPNNPLYPFVLGRGLSFEPPDHLKQYLGQSANLAPEWHWNRLAQASSLWVEKKHAEAACELEEFLRSEPDYEPAWFQLAGSLAKLERWAEAERAYRKAAELRSDSVSLGVWRMRLKAAGESDRAKRQLRRELVRLQKTNLPSRHRMTIARAYRELLGDEAAARAMEDALKRSHPDWERDWVEFEHVSSSMWWGDWDGPGRAFYSGRDAWLAGQRSRLRAEKDPSRKIARFQALLQPGPRPSLRRDLQDDLLEVQIEAKEWQGAKSTVAELSASNPETIGHRLRLALALADNKVELDEALRLVLEAKAARHEFQPWVRPRQFLSEVWEEQYGSREKQRQTYNNTLGAIADAQGWVLAQQGNVEQAERELRMAVGLNPTQQALYHLGLILDRRGQTEDALELLVKAAAQQGSHQGAARQAAEAVLQKQTAAGVDALIERVHTARVDNKREQMRKELFEQPAKDFELVSLDGQRYQLSALRGQVVLLNFWSTWCGPCLAEMPELVRLYQKRHEAGLEILAISIDEDKSKVAQFVSEHKLPFPVLLDNQVGSLYGVGGIPDNFFIDRAGNLRYRHVGFGPGSETEVAAVVEELLTSPPAPAPTKPNR